MSEFNIETYLSGFVGISPDSPVRKSEQAKTANVNEQGNKGQVNAFAPSNTQDVFEAVTEVNDLLHNMNRNLSFSVDEESGDSIILIKDSESDEVIRQIPSEELLVIRKKMDYLVGVLFDAKV